MMSTLAALEGPMNWSSLYQVLMQVYAKGGVKCSTKLVLGLENGRYARVYCEKPS